MRDKKDLRVIKTQKVLYNALASLLKNKAFEEIKVSDICSEALINRSTFYDHYNDKYELLVDFINNEKQTLEEYLEQNEHISNTKAYYMEMIKLLLNHIEDQKDLYYSVLIHNRNSIVMDIFMDVVIKDVEKRVKNEIPNKIPSEIITKFYIGAVVNIGMEWLKNNSKYTKDEMFNFINTLIPDNIDSL